MRDFDELDNMAWHALAGPHAPLAQYSTDGGARRYPRDVSPFCAAAGTSESDWASLAELVAGRAAVLAMVGEIATPPGWDELFRDSLTQYVAVDPDSEPDLDSDLDIVALDIGDVDEMIELTALTEPGPFLTRTIELGHYIGIREEGVLIAMAGERMQTDRFSEISAVCVHPTARRRGLGAALTTTLVHHIADRGKQAMLHVVDGNTAAHQLYQAIGFAARSRLTVGAWRVSRDT